MSKKYTVSKSINCHWYESKTLQNDLYTVAIKNDLVRINDLFEKQQAEEVKKVLLILHNNIKFFSKGHYDTEDIFNKYVVEQKRDYEKGLINEFENNLQLEQFESIKNSVKNEVYKVSYKYNKINDFYGNDEQCIIVKKAKVVKLTKAEKREENRKKWAEIRGKRNFNFWNCK